MTLILVSDWSGVASPGADVRRGVRQHSAGDDDDSDDSDDDDDNMVQFVRESNVAGDTRDTIPTAVLLTGVNMPDHNKVSGYWFKLKN